MLHGFNLWLIAMHIGPEPFGIALDKHIFVNFSAKSKQKLKIFKGVDQGPRGNQFTIKT
jgi:hypothetical protein